LISSLVSVLVLLVLCAGLVGLEFSLISSQEDELEKAKSGNRFGADSAISALTNLQRSLDTIHLLRTFFTFLLAIIGTKFLSKILGFSLRGLSPDRFSAGGGGSLEELGMSLLLLVISVLLFSATHLFLGHSLAKAVALKSPERYLRVCSPFLGALGLFVAPILFFAERFRSFLSSLFNLQVPERIISSAELDLIIEKTEGHVQLDEDDEELIQGVVGFSRKLVSEVMRPRSDMIAIDSEASLAEVVEVIRESGFSRFPVYSERVDNVVGVLLARDLMKQFSSLLSECKSKDVAEDASKTFSVSQVIREPFFVANDIPIDDLLKEFKLRKVHLAVIMDEHGGVDGLVTLEDLIEEIVGDIFDESDPEEIEIVEHEDHLELDGGVSISEINERFKVDIPEGDYDTIAGYLMARLGRMPEEGDRVGILSEERVNGDSNGTSSGPKAFLEVSKVDSNRIQLIKLFGLEPV